MHGGSHGEKGDCDTDHDEHIDEESDPVVSWVQVMDYLLTKNIVFSWKNWSKLIYWKVISCFSIFYCLAAI